MKSISRQWFISVLVLPVLAGAMVLVARWGRESLAQMILFPSLLVAWRLFSRASQRPRMAAGSGKALAEYAIKNWHALDMLALLVLFVFEAGLVALAESKVVAPHVWALFLSTVFLPYALLSLWGYSFLLQARRLTDQQGAAPPSLPSDAGTLTP
jgi:hypothetical protein